MNHLSFFNTPLRMWWPTWAQRYSKKQSLNAKDYQSNNVFSKDGEIVIAFKWKRTSDILGIPGALLLHGPFLLFLPWNFSHCPFN